MDEVDDTADVAAACDPLAEAGDVVVVPLLPVTEVEEAACKACSSGSALDPLVLPGSPLSPDASEPPIWAW